MIFLFFSNIDLNFDFFSKILANKIIIVSSVFFSRISSIIFTILSHHLKIIIKFFDSINDFDKIVLKKLKTYLGILMGYQFDKGSTLNGSGRCALVNPEV